MTGKPMTADEVDSVENNLPALGGRPVHTVERLIATIRQRDADFLRERAACTQAEMLFIEEKKAREQAEAERDRLREAAEPFALRISEKIGDKHYEDNYPITIVAPISEIRALRAALEGD